MSFKSPKRTARIFAVVLTVALLLPSAAFANKVLEDWRSDGTIDGKYTLAELQSARGAVSPEELEYSDFDLALNQAIAASARAGRREGSKPGSTSTTGGKTGSSASGNPKDAGKKGKKDADSNAASTKGELSDGAISAIGAESADAGSKGEDDSNMLLIGGIATLLLLLAGGGAWYFNSRKR